MKRIIIHWTAGTYQPNTHEFECYHYLINGDGLIVAGKYKPQDNENCSDGKYAPHTGGGNTGSIGVSFCGMAGFVNSNHLGKYPLKKVQLEAGFKKIAELCKAYYLKITPETVMTHYEFGQKHPYSTSFGKIDIVHLPPYPEIPQNKVGDFIRNKVSWYYQNIV